MHIASAGPSNAKTRCPPYTHSPHGYMAVCFVGDLYFPVHIQFMMIGHNYMNHQFKENFSQKNCINYENIHWMGRGILYVCVCARWLAVLVWRNARNVVLNFALEVENLLKPT